MRRVKVRGVRVRVGYSGMDNQVSTLDRNMSCLVLFCLVLLYFVLSCLVL